MKAIEKPTTRRALLRGAAATATTAVALAAIPSPATANAAEPLLELERRWQEINAEYDNVCRAHDHSRFNKTPDEPALEAAVEAAGDKWSEAIGDIADTSAVTLAGLAVKLRFVQRDVVDGPSNYAHEMIESAIADLGRLAMRGAA